MKIIRLEAENIKGLRAIEITPESNLVEVAGGNGAGKSSVLDAIWLAIGGKDASKGIASPLRKGADEGSVTIDLGTMRVTRTFNASGTTKLKVTAVSEVGEATVTGPQGVLDALRAKFLDPAGFIASTPAQQREELLGLLDLDVDLDALDADRRRLYDERTEIGRQGKAIGDVQVDDALPADETSASEIIAKIRKAEEHNREVAEADRLARDMRAGYENQKSAVARLKAQLAEAEAALQSAADALTKQDELAENMRTTDTGPLEADLATVEEINAKIRANNSARAQLVRKAELIDRYAALTKQIDTLDQKKATAIASANLPVEGLGLDASGLTLGDVPLSDASSGEQLYAALRITAALNPRLRVIQVREGSLLDEKHFQIIRDFAEAEDYQIWFETVGAGHEGAIVIEAGEVAA